VDEGPKEGIVGFFDILGYQSFLQNNSPEYAAKEVFSTLTHLDKEIPQRLLDIGQKDLPLSPMEWLIFSDTILLTSPLKGDEEDMLHTWMDFIMASLVLNSRMFTFGLPLRGAITIGKYFVQGGCFAGKPIIEAYKLTQEIDLAACIISERASHYLSSLLSKQNPEESPELFIFFRPAFIKYPVPKKNGRSEDLNALNFAYSSDFGFRKNPDLHQVVLDCFWKHNKDISPGAETKIQNTERFFRYMKFRFPEFFTPAPVPKTQNPNG